ncbi:glycoside hydrolase family 28 protein [Granulicella cerasi]|uniref:Glycoside hydrolase family 28 protein n=1 Tax=Granulicella cerasi TaxID=741063 RepID=A0ABW1ZAL0_9BACT|nr:glycosyl hydrolase family 28 protein [Granulicella cerasi]
MNRRKFLGVVPGALALHTLPAPLLWAETKTARVMSVRANGAKGTGTDLDTDALQKAIDECAAMGGGIVRVEAGTYLTGPLRLRSHVTLQLDKGATILGLPSAGKDANAPGSMSPLISAYRANNISIVGQGTINGNGKTYWVRRTDRHPVTPDREWRDVTQFNYNALPHPGQMVNLTDCRNVLVSGVTLTQSTAWTLRLFQCDGVKVQGITIDNPRYGLNTDGIDIHCTSNVLVEDCHITTGDDGVCLKSEGHPEEIRPVRNIIVRRCVIDTPCNALKIGTGTQGLFENISFSDCNVFSHYPYIGDRMLAAVALEIVDGGAIRGVSVKNITADKVRSPIFIRLGNRGTGQTKKVPGSVKDVVIANFKATNASVTSSITGLVGTKVENVRLENIDISTDEAGTAEWASRTIPEADHEYPESTVFGRLPASGFYCRHVKGLVFDNVRVTSLVPDFRPTLVCDDVSELTVSKLDVSKPQAEVPAVVLTEVRSATLKDCIAPKDSDVYLRVTGSGSSGIALQHSDMRGAKKPVDAAAGVVTVQAQA